MFASVCKLKAKELVISFGDCHIYENHIDAVKEQLKRESFDPPTIELNREIESVIDFVHDDVKLINYNCHPSIKAEVAV
jgi:thymidylate synthase